MVSDINRHVGQRMRKYRLAAGMTLQTLSEEIHKSRATVCKYENGEISIDLPGTADFGWEADWL